MIVESNPMGEMIRRIASNTLNVSSLCAGMALMLGMRINSMSSERYRSVSNVNCIVGILLLGFKKVGGGDD
jgi:hypothetical protein